MKYFVLITFTLLFYGCSSMYMPVCAKTATNSYESAEAGSDKVINKFLAIELESRGMEITILSQFIAQVEGSKKDLKWLVDNYAVMVCSFNPSLIGAEGQSLYLVCADKADTWLNLVRKEKKFKELMLDEHVYCPTCCN